MIDTLHAPLVGKKPKPRTYRIKARRQYLAVAKKKSPGQKAVRKAIRQQLSYVESVPFKQNTLSVRLN